MTRSHRSDGGRSRADVRATAAAILDRYGAHGLDEGATDRASVTAAAEPVGSTSANGHGLDGLAGLGAPALPDAALHGLLGDATRTLAPHTEGHVGGLLVSALVGAGVVLGRSPHQVAGPGAAFRCNLFALLCGETSRGRKGMATGAARALVEHVAPFFAPLIGTGLHSAEGLIHRLRDPRPGRDGTMDDKDADPGVTDKRLWVVEEEWASAMRRMRSESNTLSPTLRSAWDGRTLEVLTKMRPQRATDPHVGLIAHVTPDELRRLVDVADLANGLLNRFLYAHVEAARALPHGGAALEDVFAPGTDAGRVADALRAALVTGYTVGRADLTRAAAAWWVERYTTELRFSPYPGRLGDLTARGAPLVRRVALVYALSDGRAAVDVADLEAAHAVWRYSLASVVRTFGPSLVSARARKLAAALHVAGPAGIARGELPACAFGTHDVAKADLDAALGELAALELAHAERTPTGGRPRETWYHVLYRANPPDAAPNVRRTMRATGEKGGNGAATAPGGEAADLSHLPPYGSGDVRPCGTRLGEPRAASRCGVSPPSGQGSPCRSLPRRSGARSRTRGTP